MIVWEPGASSYGVISAQKLLAAFHRGACCMNRALHVARHSYRGAHCAHCALHVARLSDRGTHCANRALYCANRFKFHMSRTVFFIFHTMLLVTITYSIHSIALRPVMKNVSSDTVGSHKARQ